MLMGRRCCRQQLEAFALACRSFLCGNRQPDPSKERQQISLQVKCQVMWVSLIIKQSYHSLPHNRKPGHCHDYLALCTEQQLPTCLT